MTLLTEHKPLRRNYRTKSSFRRDWLRRLRDSDLLDLSRDLGAEVRRRRKASVEAIHDGDVTNKIRWWRACPICKSRSCRSQSCRNAERRMARGSR
jgi:hypothetical protein